jgi:transposase-like protein
MSRNLKHYARPVGDSWRVDETYIKVKGQWVYLYRAVDKQGRTVDFLLSKRRDVVAAKRFFSRAAKQHGAPRVITLDGYAASHRAVDNHRANLRNGDLRQVQAIDGNTITLDNGYKLDASKPSHIRQGYTMTSQVRKGTRTRKCSPSGSGANC